MAIDNFKKNLNSSISKLGKAVYKEHSSLNIVQKKADNLLNTIKTKHSDGNITDAQISVYKVDLNRVIMTYNKVHKIVIFTKARLVSIDKIITALNAIITTLSIIVNTLKILPVPSQFSTLGVIMLLSSKLNDASTVINDARKYVNISTIVVKALVELFNKLLADLEKLQTTIQAILALLVNKSKSFQSDLALEQSDSLSTFQLSESNNLGTYKEYTFELRTDDDPEFIIGDIKRRYATATLKGRDVYFSDKSYTLNPEILIDQLKLQIDNQ